MGKLSQRAPYLHTWLTLIDTPRHADLIFVLAGGMDRKEYALQLFQRGFAPRILLSVGRFEIRRFSKMDLPVPLDLLKLAQELPPPQRHYFVLFYNQLVEVEHVPPRRFGTLTEIEALARWLGQNPEISSILVVSTSIHLRRIRMCCRAFLGSKAIDFAFLPTSASVDRLGDPASSETAPGQSPLPKHSSFATTKAELLELFKLGVYWVLLKFR